MSTLEIDIVVLHSRMNYFYYYVPVLCYKNSSAYISIHEMSINKPFRKHVFNINKCKVVVNVNAKQKLRRYIKKEYENA